MNSYGFNLCVLSGDRVVGFPNLFSFRDRSACSSVSRCVPWLIRGIRRKDA